MYDDISHLLKAPLLTATEERRLVRAAKAGNEIARCRLVESNIRLVAKFAKSYTSSGIPFADLVQEGSLGLLRAIKKYDLNSGFRFNTYAGQWVRQALSRAVDNTSRFIRLPSYIHEYARKINKAKVALFQLTGNEPDIETLAAWLEWPEKKLRKILSQLGEVVSLDDVVGDTNLGSLIEAEVAGPEEELLLTAGTLELSTLLSTLNDAEKTVLTMRLNDDAFDDIHAATGMSRERIKGLEASALRKLADKARTLALVAML